MKLILGDCLDVLKKTESQTVDSIVCDPPYGIGIGGSWDKALPDNKIWQEAFRVLKPGGHILAFASARVYHRLACSMEEAGFETQNMLAWLYGNGFPKGADTARECDRSEGRPEPDDDFREYLREAVKRSPYKIADLEKMCGTNSMFSHYLGKSQPAFPTFRIWKILKKALALDSTYDTLFAEIEKRRVEFKMTKERRENVLHFKGLGKNFKRHIPRCKEAKKWAGWRHGKMVLRPCMEPIYFGRRPPLKPMKKNLALYGVGALNIQSCKARGRDGKIRFPGNVAHDGSPEVVRRLSRESETAVSSFNEFRTGREDVPFFYVPKPSKGEKGAGNTHPTVKPVSLMSQLVRLVTPPGGVCLDPFMGSGTTGIACVLEGAEFVGIERDADYFAIAKDRISRVWEKIRSTQSSERGDF